MRIVFRLIQGVLNKPVQDRPVSRLVEWSFFTSSSTFSLMSGGISLPLTLATCAKTLRHLSALPWDEYHLKDSLVNLLKLLLPMMLWKKAKAGAYQGKMTMAVTCKNKA